MYDVEKIRNDFPILSREVYGKPLVYLDNGGTAQKPRTMIEVVNDWHNRSNANIHRGRHLLSEESTEAYELAREQVRSFIGARSGREIIFTSGATASINTVAYSFGERFVSEGDNLIVSEMEHHSNIVPWQQLCARKRAHLRVLPFADDGRLCIEHLSELIDSNTRLLCITQASNILGTRPNLSEAIALAHAADVAVLVDGCQGVVHGSVDVQDLGCDFYVFSGHKLYGPTGIGVLYGQEHWLEQMPPFMGGGDMVASVSFEGTTYAELPLKFEAGTANYIGAIGLGESIRYLESLDRSAVAQHEASLLQEATRRLQGIEGVKIYGEQPDKCSILSFTVEGVHPEDMGMILDKMGVAVRTGTHCASPLMQHYGVTSMVRASFALYNTHQEVDAFERAVRKAITMLR